MRRRRGAQWRVRCNIRQSEGATQQTKNETALGEMIAEGRVREVEHERDACSLVCERLFRAKGLDRVYRGGAARR
jgi:L-2-hydroxyglutarate oxidase LhgO